jgi:hypothetical protein
MNPDGKNACHASLTPTSETWSSLPGYLTCRSPFAQHRLLTLLPGRYGAFIAFRSTEEKNNERTITLKTI